MKIVACYSSKGGVGKTASAVNLSYASALRGKRTLLIDLDVQGASTFYFRIRAPKKHSAKRVLSGKSSAVNAIRETDYAGLHILPAHATYRNFDALLDGMKRSKVRLAEFVKAVGKDYDRVILDCPPSLSLVAENVFEASNVVLIPVIPTTLSQRTYGQLKTFFKESEFKTKKLRPFFSMVDRRKRMHLDTMDAMVESEKRMLKSCIPFSAEVEAMGAHQEPLLSFAPKHPASLAFLDLWNEVEAL